MAISCALQVFACLISAQQPLTRAHTPVDGTLSMLAMLRSPFAWPRLTIPLVSGPCTAISRDPTRHRSMQTRRGKVLEPLDPGTASDSGHQDSAASRVPAFLTKTCEPLPPRFAWPADGQCWDATRPFSGAGMSWPARSPTQRSSPGQRMASGAAPGHVLYQQLLNPG